MSEAARRGRIVEAEEDLAAIVRDMQVIAVVGMKGEQQGDESAHEIPKLVKSRGKRIVPVNPKLTATLGERAWPDLASIPEPFDLVDVFRRIDAIPGVADQILALPAERRPKVVWLQSGIRHDDAASRLAEAGIDVVQDRCLGVYASRYLR
ncbi:MAG: CoA-binding protein [Thermoanaerobaculia bacterium]|nr:MAG: CoA-binding protein [Thermoanaerobaculia bacterium]MBZ0102625.1 CoA-binding protein [Thermoanaerobaculia bacterium]